MLDWLDEGGRGETSAPTCPQLVYSLLECLYLSSMYCYLVFTCFSIWEFNYLTRSLGNLYRAAANALNLEQWRLQKLKELCEGNQMIRSSYNEVFLKLDVWGFVSSMQEVIPTSLLTTLSYFLIEYYPS